MTSGGRTNTGVDAFTAAYQRSLSQTNKRVNKAKEDADTYSNASALAGNLAGRSLNL
jgi:hypothetical protein